MLVVKTGNNEAAPKSAPREEILRKPLIQGAS